MNTTTTVRAVHSPECMKTYVSRISMIALLLAGVGCGAGDPDAARLEGLATAAQPLYLKGTKWPGGVVHVCWAPASTSWPNFESVAKTVRDYMNNSWPTVANVEFVGWKTCTASQTRGVVSILLKSGDGNHVRPFVGYSAAMASTMTLDPNDGRFPSITIPHEAGHVLGFAHEFQRSDFPMTTATDDSGASFVCGPSETLSGGSFLDTPPDPQSQLASTYCGNRAEVSVWDTVGAINAYGPRTTAVRPLVTAFSWDRLDNVMVSSAAGIADVKAVSSYVWTYGNGWVLANGGAAGTIPLKLYWNGSRTDNVTLASSATQAEVTAAGYGFIRTEGFVFSSQQPGTVPLKQYFNSGNQDYILTTPGRSEQDAIAAGYSFVRTEGFIPDKVPYSLLWTYSYVFNDNVMTGQNSNLAASVGGEGYTFVGFEGAAWNFQYPGTTPLKNFHKRSGLVTRDHFTLAHATSESTAVAAGYSSVTSEYSGSPGGRKAFVYTSSVCSGFACSPWTLPVRSYNHPTSREYWTTVTRGLDALTAGYQIVRTEGHVIPIIQ